MPLPLPNSRRTLLISAVLCAITLATFWPIVHHDFITYDDGVYLTGNPHVQEGLSWNSVAWAFRTTYAGNWHPITWLSHLLDVQLFGLNPGWHHFISLLFHTANTVLLFLLLRLLTGATWRSGVVAALFALHPLHVESVAWAAERRDVLSAFFFLLALLAYCRYAEEIGDRRRQAGDSAQDSASSVTEHGIRNTVHHSRFTIHFSRWYFLALLLFTLGLMSKPMLVTLPFVLLLLDYWPLRRLPFRPLASSIHPSIHQSINPALPHSTTPALRLLLEKLPFFALTAAFSLITLRAQRGASAVVPMAALSFTDRLSNAILACAAYLEKMVWPVQLSLIYPRWTNLSAFQILLPSLVLVAITFWAVRGSLLRSARLPLPATKEWGEGQGEGSSLVTPTAVASRGRPHLAVGWFWFLGMLVPVSGLVQVGLQPMADRFTYLPLIGIFLMLVWHIAGDRSQHPPSTIHHPASSIRPPSSILRSFSAVGAAVALLACAAATRHQLAYWQNAETLFAHVLRVTGPNYIALNNHGVALTQHGKLDEAIRDFELAVALDPALDAARFSLGQALLQQGKYDAAAEQFSTVLQLKPGHPAARLQLGLARARQGKYDEAIAAFSDALRLDPDNAEAHNNLGNVLVLQGRHGEALGHFAEAVRLNPSNPKAHNNLAITCKKLGRTSEAIAQYHEAIRLLPDFLEALNNLAWTLAASPDAQFRNASEAIQLATRACELTRYEHPLLLATLAAAYAEAGQFTEAISFAERAQQLIPSPQSPLAAKLQSMLETFRSGRPYRAD